MLNLLEETLYVARELAAMFDSARATYTPTLLHIVGCILYMLWFYLG